MLAIPPKRTDKAVVTYLTEDEAVVRSWLTKLNRVPVYDTSRLDAARDYYVRITSPPHPFVDSTHH